MKYNIALSFLSTCIDLFDLHYVLTLHRIYDFV
jgi:hypothetical protein